MDRDKLVTVIFINKGRNDTVLSIIDNRGVVSDCTYLIKLGSSLVPVSIHREIEQGA